MSSERVPCKNPECHHTILPATAKANDGLCAPCVRAIRQAEWAEYVRQNRRTVRNLYEGVTDPVEAICILLTRRKHDPLIQYLPAPKTVAQFFQDLTETQAERLAGVAADAMKSGNEYFADDIAKSLATLTALNLDTMLGAWLDEFHLWPSIAFRNAGADIRDRIFSVMQGRAVSLNQALPALAWIGDEAVQKQFAAWEDHPPAWHQNLKVGPAYYAEVGGWELSGGARRNLFRDECFALVVAEPGHVVSRVNLIREKKEPCPWCGDPLIHLIEIPADEPEFAFLEFQGGTLPVLTCERCACWEGPLFARVENDGRARWHPANRRRDNPIGRNFKWERGPWKGLAVTLQHRTAIHAADWCMGLPGTQIGGMPTWVQNPAYPKCPDCSRTMGFLAQLDNGQFPRHEGIYYAFWCAGCRTTATTYQQS